MLPKRKILLTAALLAGLANAPAPVTDMPPPPIGITPPQTKDKFTIDVMRAWIGDAAALLDNGQLAEAQASVEQRVRDMTDANRAGDTFEAFGVLTYVSEAGEEADRKRVAIDFLGRAVDAYRRPGGDPALLAVALSSLGDAIANKDASKTDPRSLTALNEGYQVRLKHFGPNNAETAFVLADSASVQGAPERTGRDPAKVEAAAARFRLAIDTESQTTERQPYDYIFIRNMFSRMYAKNGMAMQAWSRVEQTRTAYRDRLREDGESCARMINGVRQLGATFDAAGLKDDAMRATAMAQEMQDKSCGA